MATIKLKKERKKDIVLNSILQQIKGGMINPGDRLASVKELCATYGYSQRIICAALADLADRNLLRIRHRSGTIVCEGARERALRDDAPAGPEIPEAAAIDHAQYLFPKAKRKLLKFYISDIYEPNLALWRLALDEFKARRGDLEVKTFTFKDGHPEELCAKEQLDIVLTTPRILESLGAGKSFLPMPDLEAEGIKPSRLLPLVRQCLEKGKPTWGIPFSITTRSLYTNLDLAEKAGVDASAPGSLGEMVQRARQFEESAREDPAQAMGLLPSNLYDLLFLEGAFESDGEALVLNAGKAQRCLKLFADAAFRSRYLLDQVPLFLQSRIMYLLHYSFTTIELRGGARCRWKVSPLPMAKGALIPAMLMVFAINRGSASPADCLDLIRFFCGDDIQARFAQLGGNLPVMEAALFDKATLARHPLSEPELRQLLSHHTLLWPDDTSWEASIMRAGIDMGFMRREMDAPSALESLRRVIEQSGVDLKIK